MGGWSFAEYGDRVARAASALRAMGLPGERIILMMRNIPEFHVLDMAALMCGATPISVFNSSSSEQIAYLVGHCGAKVAIVEDAGFLARFTPVRTSSATSKAIGMLRPDGADSAVAFDVAEMLEHDLADLEAAAARRPGRPRHGHLTSGTTGPPKGAMITNSNVTWTVECLRTAIAIEDLAGKRPVSYLPMAHIAERMTSHYQQAVAGYEVTCCPRARQIAAYARGEAEHHVRGPGLGEDPGRCRRGHRGGRRPGPPVRRGDRGGQANRAPRGLGRGHRRGPCHLGLPGRRRAPGRA